MCGASGMPPSNPKPPAAPSLPEHPQPPPVPKEGGDAKGWHPPAAGTGATFPPSPDATLRLGSSPGGFYYPAADDGQLTNHITPPQHAGSRATTALGGEHGQVPTTPPSSSPWPPRPLCLHPSPAAGFGVQPPPSHLVPGTRRVAPCPGTVPSCPINPGQPQVVGCWCCTGWLASPWGACRGTGRWDRSPAAAPHPKKGTSTGARGTGLTSERPVPLLPLQQ